MTPQKKIIPAALIVAAVVLGYVAWQKMRPTGPGDGFVSGNGRIEATEIDVATKLTSRVNSITVREGDFVKAGQPLATMQVDSLSAQRDEARARAEQVRDGGGRTGTSGRARKRQGCCVSRGGAARKRTRCGPAPPGPFRNPVERGRIIGAGAR